MENLPSFLSLGKALLLLFVGEEEDDIGHRQNQALVEEMKGVVELGWRKMDRYLASWIHLYVHQSALIFNQYETGFVLSPSIMYTDKTPPVSSFSIFVDLSSSGRTPAGMSVLGSYLGSMPPLPALVLTHLPSGGEIYQYPPNTPIVAPSVLQWLHRIEDGTETPTGRRKVEEVKKIKDNSI